MIVPEAIVSVQRIGREGEPLVIIDDFTGQPVRCKDRRAGKDKPRRDRSRRG
jgi:hypothetical protein